MRKIIPIILVAYLVSGCDSMTTAEPDFVVELYEPTDEVSLISTLTDRETTLWVYGRRFEDSVADLVFSYEAYDISVNASFHATGLSLEVLFGGSDTVISVESEQTSNGTHIRVFASDNFARPSILVLDTVATNILYSRADHALIGQSKRNHNDDGAIEAACTAATLGVRNIPAMLSIAEILNSRNVYETLASIGLINLPESIQAIFSPFGALNLTLQQVDLSVCEEYGLTDRNSSRLRPSTDFNFILDMIPGARVSLQLTVSTDTFDTFRLGPLDNNDQIIPFTDYIVGPSSTRQFKVDFYRTSPLAYERRNFFWEALDCPDNTCDFNLTIRSLNIPVQLSVSGIPSISDGRYVSQSFASAAVNQPRRFTLRPIPE